MYLQRLALIGIGLSLALAGCSSPAPRNDASWANEYDTVDQVVADSDLVIIGTAVRQERVADDEAGTELSTTLTTLNVDEVRLGDGVSSTVKVRSSDGFGRDEAVAFDVGSSYLVFLEEFEFVPGEGTGTYITVGQVAAYEVSDPSGRGGSPDGQLVERVTTRGGLPVHASLAEILGAVA